MDGVLIDAYPQSAHDLRHFPARLSSAQTASGVVVVAVCSLAAYVIYQLFLHPLSSHPGPLLGRLTQCYDAYHAYKGDKHVLFLRLHERYGPVVRFSPNCLSVNDPAALRTIYAHAANVRKSSFYECFRAAPYAISTLLATDKKHHARKRRILGPAFSDDALRSLEPYVVAHVQLLVDRISDAASTAAAAAAAAAASSSSRSSAESLQWSSPLDMATWCNWLVFDIMGDLVFGRSFGTLGQAPQNRRAIHLLVRAARRNYVVAAMPSLLHTGLERFLPFLRSLYLDRCDYLAFGRRVVQERTAEHAASEPSEKPVRKDIFSFLLHAKDPVTGDGMPMPELWMEGNTLIVAGSDTTSTTLAAALFYLVRNPSVLQRLQNEIRTTFPSPDHILLGPLLSSCTYLRACIDETLRMSPAIAGLLPRTVLEGGLSLPSLGLHLPAGVDVGVPIYAIHHNESFVQDPFRFLPDRFLAPDRDPLLSVFSPFSLGNRSCLGKPLVYMELGIALARLLWAFDARLSEDSDQQQDLEYPTKDWFLSGKKGPLVEWKLPST